MADITIELTDEEWSEALRAGMAAALEARFEQGKPEQAADIGLKVGKARAHELARQRLEHGR
ncbi:MAG: hypothetical protein CVT64_11930 [Actinobacteria bacterium HGW-Actinobacteria-4]|nr:MAG: hypothetical protein CVT64_11930 [Actinobacteria bacterium HGW-Actinobacteria-4]